MERAIGMELLDRVWVESPFGPEANGEGWGRKSWQRRPFSVQRIELDADNRSGRLVLLDRRPLDALIWDTGWSRLDVARVEGGTARFTPGVTRSFARSSDVWIPSPSDADVIVEVPMDEPAIAYDGELFEGNSANELLRSSLLAGTTGLTLTGTGVNGSAIAADTATLLFDPIITENSLKFTAGNPQANELVAEWPDTGTINVGLGQDFKLSIDHMDDSGATLYFRLERLYDNQFWDDSGSTWGSTVDNAITNSTTRARFQSKLIDVGSNNSAFTLEILQQTGGTASRVNYVFHVQFEKMRFATSRIVTDTESRTRNYTDLKIYQESATRRCYWTEQGTLLAEVVPHWSSSELASGLKYTVAIITDQAEPEVFHDWVYYDSTAGQWVFERYIDDGTPVTYKATYTASVTRGTAYKIAARWTGVEAELDLAAYTYSIFVDGTKGTDDVGKAVPTIDWDGSQFLKIGDAENSSTFEGHIRRRLVRPYPMTDGEVARFEA
jgi:hypothetical protein